MPDKFSVIKDVIPNLIRIPGKSRDASSPETRSIRFRAYWIPACAGMTNQLFALSFIPTTKGSCRDFQNDA